MTLSIGWAITVLVAGLLLAYGGALVSLRGLPMGERPRTRTYDRFGTVIATTENPDYHENPGEDSREEPGTPPIERPPRTVTRA